MDFFKLRPGMFSGDKTYGQQNAAVFRKEHDEHFPYKYYRLPIFKKMSQLMSNKIHLRLRPSEVGIIEIIYKDTTPSSSSLI
jgi:hypothetical protein